KYVLGLGHKLVAAGSAVAETVRVFLFDVVMFGSSIRVEFPFLLSVRQSKEYIGERFHCVKGDASPTERGYEEFDKSPALAAGLFSREKRTRIAAQRRDPSTVM
ncbi:MAG: hypothetical protein ACK56I_06370, partial [bacterium]